MSQIEITGLYVSPTQGIPMQQVESVEAIKGVGLKGDRYALGIGFWQQTGKCRDRVRQGTLFFTNHLEGTQFRGIDTRRNVELSGEMNPLDLIGRTFRFGDVVMEGIWNCDPCKRPSLISEVDGYEQLEKYKGGLRFAIRESGVLKLGLPFVLVP